MAESNRLLSAALRYAERSFAVFPLRPRAKRPLTRHGVKDASRDPETIRAWWARWPDANVGIACGEASGIDALDIDGPDAEALIASYEAKHGAIEPTLSVQTAQGRHLFFEHDERMRNSASKIGPHLDTRSTDGYVVAPPSVHPTGWVYQWVFGASPSDIAEPPPWPAWALAPFVRGEPWRSGLGMDAQQRRARYCETALEGEAEALASTPLGSRNEAIRDAAARLGGLVHLGAFDELDVERALRRAIESWPREERKPRKDLDTLRRGLRWGINNPRPDPDFGEVPPEASAASATEDRLLTRPVIRIRTEEEEVVDEAVAALAQVPDLNLYQRARTLVRVVRDPSPRKAHIVRPKNAPHVQACALPTLRVHLSSAALWLKHDGRRKKHPWSPAHPPLWAVQAVSAQGSWEGLRPLEAVVEHPVLRPDGTLLERRGYDEATGLLLEPMGAHHPVPSEPTLEQAQAAVEELLDVVRDFPFETPAHRAAWLAGVLTPFARYAIEGPCPLFLVTANVRGAGKTLLADIAGVIATGRPLATTVWDREEAEMRKRITTLAIEGTPIVLLDNVGSTLGNATFDAALTKTTWSDRVLGKSESTSMPLLAIWWATGNNTALGADTARRTLHVRLLTQEERPEDRNDFTFDEPLRSWTARHRPGLVSAALTILRGFCVAGRPDGGLQPWGSFEAWSSLVRAAVVWAGQPDPLETREALMESSDQDGMALRDLLEAWFAVYQDQPRQLSAVFEDMSKPHAASGPFAERYGALQEALTSFCRSDKASTRLLARRLRQIRGRVVDGRCFDQPPRTTKSKKARAWSVVTIRPGGVGV